MNRVYISDIKAGSDTFADFSSTSWRNSVAVVFKDCKVEFFDSTYIEDEDNWDEETDTCPKTLVVGFGEWYDSCDDDSDMGVLKSIYGDKVDDIEYVDLEVGDASYGYCSKEWRETYSEAYLKAWEEWYEPANAEA